jgi:hypothetical protein
MENISIKKSKKEFKKEHGFTPYSLRRGFKKKPIRKFKGQSLIGPLGNPGSTTGSILKWSAIILGGYFLSRSFGFSIPILSPILDSIFGPPIPVTPATAGTTATSTQTSATKSSNTPAGSTNTGSGASQTAATAKTPLLALVKGDNATTMGWDQWNYYYNQLFGKFLSSKTVDRTKKYTIDQFFSLGGLSGIGLGNYFYNRGGVGVIANRDPYKNPRGQGVVGLFPVGPYAVPVNSYSFALRGLGDLLYKHGGEGARTTSDFKSGSGKPTGAEKMNIRYM